MGLNSFIRLFLLSILIAVFACKNHPKTNLLAGDYTLISIQYYDSAFQVWKTSDWMNGATGKLSYMKNDTMQVEFLPANYSNTKQGRYAYSASYTYNLETQICSHQRYWHTNKEEANELVKRKLVLENDTLTMFAEEHGLKLTWIKQ